MSKFRIGETYALIRSMSGHERAYFTERVDEAADYFSLYRDLAEMAEFDAQLLKKKYTNLNGIANYLYESILKNMRNYRSNTFRSNQIKESLIDNQFLWEKGHYQQCMNKLDKARQEAENLGDLLLLLEVNRQERHMSWFQEDKKGIKEKVQHLADESLSILEMLKEEVHFYNLYYELYTILREKNKLTTPEEKTALKKAFPASLFEKSKLPKSKHGQRRFYLCTAFYYRLLGDNHRAHESFVETLEWWKKHRAIKEEDSFWYASDLINVIRSYMVIGNFDLIEGLLKKLDKLENENKNPHLQRFIFENSMFLRHVYFMNVKRYRDAKKLIPKIEIGLEKYASDETRYLSLIYNVAVNFFLLEDYEDCINWCKKITAIRGPFFMNLRKGIRLMQICSCFELDNDDFAFKSNWKTVNTYFQRLSKKESVDFEIKSLEFLKEMYTAKLIDKTANRFQAFLRKQLESGKPSGCEEISIWLSKYSPIR